MSSIDEIISERVAKAETERKAAEEEIKRANALTRMRELAETVRCFWPGRTQDPEYDPWDVPRTKPPSQKYWENFAGAIIELCKAAKSLDFDGKLDAKGGKEEEYVQEIFRLAFGRRKKKPAELLSKLRDFDTDFRERCDQLIRAEYPRRILLAVGEEEVPDTLESPPKTKNVNFTPPDGVEFSKARPPKFWRTAYAERGQDISQNTFLRRIKSGKIRVHPTYTTKSYCIDKRDWPLGYNDGQ